MQALFRSLNYLLSIICLKICNLVALSKMRPMSVRRRPRAHLYAKSYLFARTGLSSEPEIGRRGMSGEAARQGKAADLPEASIRSRLRFGYQVGSEGAGAGGLFVGNLVSRCEG